MKSSTIRGCVSMGECVLLKILYGESTLRGHSAEQKKLGGHSRLGHGHQRVDSMFQERGVEHWEENMEALLWRRNYLLNCFLMIT